MDDWGPTTRSCLQVTSLQITLATSAQSCQERRSVDSDSGAPETSRPSPTAPRLSGPVLTHLQPGQLEPGVGLWPGAWPSFCEFLMGIIVSLVSAPLVTTGNLPASFVSFS